jgi:hypothetical protein
MLSLTHAQPELETLRGCGRMAPLGWGEVGADEKQKRAERREQRDREVEASQNALRASIKETQRLMDASDDMLRRHRREAEEDDTTDA